MSVRIEDVHTDVTVLPGSHPPEAESGGSSRPSEEEELERARRRARMAARIRAEGFDD
jgi:hypothetical protein